MFSLEKKHLKAYWKERKEIKENGKIINENRTNFYKIFNYLINEYYTTLKKEFSDSEIIKECDIKDVILKEIKEFLKNKNIAKCEEDRIIINYETVDFLYKLVCDYKIFYIMNSLNILTFFTSLLAIAFSLLNKSLLQWIAPITIIIFLILLNRIIHSRIDKIEKNSK